MTNPVITKHNENYKIEHNPFMRYRNHPKRQQSHDPAKTCFLLLFTRHFSLYSSVVIILAKDLRFMFWAVIYSDFLKCWLSQSGTFGKQCAGEKKGYAAAISSPHHLDKGLQKMCMCVCLRLPAVGHSPQNVEPHEINKSKKKKKKKRGIFFST